MPFVTISHHISITYILFILILSKDFFFKKRFPPNALKSKSKSPPKTVLFFITFMSSKLLNIPQSLESVDSYPDSVFQLEKLMNKAWLLFCQFSFLVNPKIFFHYNLLLRLNFLFSIVLDPLQKSVFSGIIQVH